MYGPDLGHERGEARRGQGAWETSRSAKPGERRDLLQALYQAALTCGDAAGEVIDLRISFFASFRSVSGYAVDPPHVLPGDARTPSDSPQKSGRFGP